MSKEQAPGALKTHVRPGCMECVTSVCDECGPPCAPITSDRISRGLEGVAQPLSGVITMLETIAQFGMTAFSHGKPTPNHELCLRFAQELRELARHQQNVSQVEFYRGVIAALGALAPHSRHGDVKHDEIVRSVGKEGLYAVAEPEDVEWAGLDPVFYVAVHATPAAQQVPSAVEENPG